MTDGGAPRSIAHHGLFVSTGHRTPPRGLTTTARVVCIYGGFMLNPTHHGAPHSTTGCLHPQGHPPFHGGTQPYRVVYIYMESTPYDEGWTPHPIIGCLYPVSTRAKHATTGCVSSIFGFPATLNVTKPSRVSPTSNSTWNSISHGTRSSASLNVY